MTAKPAVSKPAVSELGIDLAAQAWHRSGPGDGAIEVAFARGGPAGDVEWILMRVAGDPGQRVLVFDRHEWECFLDGARNGEFDAAAARPPRPADSVRLLRSLT
ncbi:MAG TPA: DUF397 domain-containing protein [Streptosporangiaceae bacterium]|nr:DUF397 domain-containing protein [Streptosporangiaceae bacterium]